MGFGGLRPIPTGDAAGLAAGEPRPHSEATAGRGARGRGRSALHPVPWGGAAAGPVRGPCRVKVGTGLVGSWPFSAAPAWVAATNNPPAKVIVKEATRAARGLLAQVFWHNPFSSGLSGAHASLHALVAGALAGLGQGLPASELGQAFAWPFLLGWPGAALPDSAPALWCAMLLGAAAGLGWLRRADWVARLRRTGGDGPSLAAVLAAAVPAFVLRWLLRRFTIQLEAAATVGLCLALTGELILLLQRWADRQEDGGGNVSPWLAALVGLAAGASALPGLSMLAVLLAGALLARVRPAAAGRFALMVAAVVALLLGLAALRPALGQLSLGVPFALLGAAAGSWAGGWLLLRWLGPARRRVLPVLASYCAAVGGLLILLGVFSA